jgi:Family of unknown function (DUF6682)
MAILVSDIASAGAEIMLDLSMVRYTSAKWISWVNDGQLTIASLKPGANSETAVLSMVAGVVQMVSSSYHCLIRPLQNMGTDGVTPGTVVKTADFDHFSERNPTWMAAAASAAVKFIMLDEDSPMTYYTYPPQPSGSSAQGTIKAMMGVIPASLTALTDAIILNDIYYPHLLNYALYRARSISTSPYSKQQAMAAWNLFVTGIGRKDMIDKIYSPNRNREKEQNKANDGQIR